MRHAVCSAMGVAMVAFGSVCATPAHAAPTCQGKEATIVDEDGGDVVGTDGDDLIVARGYEADVMAMAGDDTVCSEVRLVVVHAGEGHDSVQARVTDELGVVDVREGEDLDIALPGGPLATVRLEFTHGGAGVIDFGPGGGDLQVYNRSSVDVDLEDGLMALDAESPTYQLRGVRDVTASARLVEVVGDRRENLLYVVSNSCRAVLKGGRGNDTLLMIGNWDLPDFRCGRSEVTRFLGQRGNDQLLGRYKDDVLIGGPGRDFARGARGTDKCRAERTKNCER